MVSVDEEGYTYDDGVKHEDVIVRNEVGVSHRIVDNTKVCSGSDKGEDTYGPEKCFPTKRIQIWMLVDVCIRR